MDKIIENGEEIYEYINKYINPHSDSIDTTHHSRKVCELVREATQDDELLIRKVLDVLNEHALSCSKFAIKFAICMASNQWRKETNEHKIRTVVINVLQKNYTDRDQFKTVDYQRMYNSIMILGEYFHRFRLKSGAPIRVLATFLLKHLTDELTEQMEASTVSPVFAELIFSQVTLNGVLFEQNCQPEINKLLLVIRKCLIYPPNLEVATRTYLLMTLDLFYSKFGRMDQFLEEMYVKFLLDTKKSESNEEAKKEGVVKVKTVEIAESDKTAAVELGKGTSEAPPQETCEKLPEETNDPDIPTIVAPAAENSDEGTTKEMQSLKTAEEITHCLNTNGYKLYKKKKSTEDTSNNSSNDSSSDQNNSKSDVESTSNTISGNVSTDCQPSDAAWPTENLNEIDQNNYTITRLNADDTTNELNNFNKNRFQRGNKKLTSNGNGSKGKSRSSDSQKKNNQQKADSQNDTPRFTVHKDKKPNSRNNVTTDEW